MSITNIYSYSEPDDEMLHLSKTMHAFFTEDKTEFISFDSSFQDPFGTNWFAKIKECMKIRDNSPCKDIQQKLNTEIKVKMEECRQAYSNLRYYVKIAFPNRDDILSRFGFDNYSRARKNRTEMIDLLTTFYNNALEFADELISVGYTHEKINRLNSIREKLVAVDCTQRDKENTLALYNCFSNCYVYMLKTSEAGKLIFILDPVRYERYLLPSEKQNEVETELDTIK